jgi:spore coat protein U-like protein
MELSKFLKPSFGAAALICAAVAAGPKAASPTTATTTFTVTTDVQTACVVSATPLNFGTYVSTAVSNATSTVTVQCNNLTAYNVGLDAGTNTGATTSTRAMTGPTGAIPLPYFLYSDSAMTKNWGDTIGTDTVPGTGNGSGQPLTVYGHIAAGNPSRQGVYTDTITVTVTF